MHSISEKTFKRAHNLLCVIESMCRGDDVGRKKKPSLSILSAYISVFDIICQWLVLSLLEVLSLVFKGPVRRTGKKPEPN